jgi:hypothetical protein
MNNKSEKVEVICIGNTFAANGSFDFNLKLKQPAYKLIVRSTSFINDKTGTSIYTLKSDLVKGKVLTNFIDGLSIDSKYVFTEQAPFESGQYTFNVQTNLGINANITGQFVMFIEFHYM